MFSTSGLLLCIFSTEFLSTLTSSLEWLFLTALCLEKLTIKVLFFHPYFLSSHECLNT